MAVLPSSTSAAPNSLVLLGNLLRVPSVTIQATNEDFWVAISSAALPLPFQP